MNLYQDMEAWQHQDQLEQQECLIEILVTAHQGFTLKTDEVELLASALGLSKEFKQAIEA